MMLLGNILYTTWALFMVQTNVGPVQAMWMLLSSLLMFSNFYRLDLEHLHHAVERHALEKPFEALQACNQKF